MTPFFSWKEIPQRQRGLSFDDVLLIPCKSEIRSRRDPILTSRVTKKRAFSVPVISANMDTVTEAEMAIAMAQLGGVGILHRFMTIEEQAVQVQKVADAGIDVVAASIGVNEDWRQRAKALVTAGCQILTVDIAHGHSVAMLETIKWLKDSFDIEVIAGNIATPEGVIELAEAGADAIKVGIGPGSMCTTRIITGCGVPQLTAIAICATAGKEHDIPIIADGGIKTSGDILKAFAAGADSVMLGSLLSGTIETPGEIKKGKKLYRGMASRSAQDSWRGGVPEGMAPEGESEMISVKGHVSDVLTELIGGVRSGMSYLNAEDFQSIRDQARFIEMSPAGFRESQAHGVRNH